MPPLVRIPVPVFAPLPVPDDGFDAPTSRLQPRQSPGRDDPQSLRTAGIVLGSIAGIIIIAIITRHFYRKYALPGHSYKAAHNEEDSPNTRQINRQNQTDLEDALADAQAGNGGLSATDTAGVDRNTSVRSVMTLPVYRPKATENERVLGREGERDGIDVVVEMTTAEQEEELRDEEMESMYQIRAARRRQIAEREERRRLRREARENNNLVALQELREQARTRNAQNTSEIDDLRYEHERIRSTRQRAVSSVSYLDVGVARADGTRVRANSTESTERVGLLSDAASIAASTLSHQQHNRNRSASTTLSIDTAVAGHDRPDTPNTLNPPNNGSTYNLTITPATRLTHSRAGSSPEIIDPDEEFASDDAPPPGYDEVSLADDIGTPTPTPGHSRRNSVVSSTARAASPYPDPPPEYPGPGVGTGTGLGIEDGSGQAGERRGSNAGRGENEQGEEEREEGERGAGGGLRVEAAGVPQIVIEPSSARP